MAFGARQCTQPGKSHPTSRRHRHDRQNGRPPPVVDVGCFSESLALVRGEQGAPPKAGYIDKSGKLVIPLQFVVADFFSHGLAPASVDGRLWGYIDRTGNFAISPQFDYAFPFFPAGIAWVKLGNAFGYIDTHGRYIWNPQK